MKKVIKPIIVLIILIYNTIIFPISFIVYNNTNLKLQPFLNPVNVSGFLPNGESYNKILPAAYYNNEKIIYIEPYKLTKFELQNVEKKGNFFFDYSNAITFNLKTALTSDLFFWQPTIESNDITIGDKSSYVVNFQNGQLILNEMKPFIKLN